MSAINNEKKKAAGGAGASQIMKDSPEVILQRKRALESRVGGGSPSASEATGMAAEKAVGALCFLPKSIHRLASRHAEDHELTAKRFFYETILLGLEQQGVITPEQRTEALAVPKDFGWKGRKP